MVNGSYGHWLKPEVDHEYQKLSLTKKNGCYQEDKTDLKETPQLSALFAALAKGSGVVLSTLVSARSHL